MADYPLDLQARFRPKGLTVTDLYQDGTAEVWLVYRTVCRGDVSPSTQKIIMYEGTRKYAVRGTSRLNLGGQHDGGRMLSTQPGKLHRPFSGSTPPSFGSNT